MNIPKSMNVKDSKSSLNVRILMIDTVGAVCSDHQRCVVAKAIKRQMKAAWVDVGVGTVLVCTGKNTVRRFCLSSLAKEQVRYFDKKKRFAPCKVVLNAPTKSLQLGARKGLQARSGPSGKSGHRAAPTR